MKQKYQRERADQTLVYIEKILKPSYFNFEFYTEKISH